MSLNSIKWPLFALGMDFVCSELVSELLCVA